MILLENLNWPYLKIWTDLIHSLENLSCPCNHELKFSQNNQDLMKWFENLNYPLLSRAEFFAKISHFCWTELKNCPCYYELKFLLKK